ncbi:MAG TPA: RlmE family RNA methyltransferase [Usitatibacteraceae bacterium]
MANARPKNSRDWVKRHLNDPFVKKAQEDGYRSRAVYKLQEIDAREGFLRPGAVVVDLGSAPGGWSQLAIKKVGSKGKVVAIDLLPMEAIPGVIFIQADFSDEAGLNAVIAELESKPVDLVISDMSPNMTGIPLTDQARLFNLGEMAMDFAVKFLQPGGVFIVKVFQGAGFEPYVKLLRQNFQHVSAKKPDASRDESREVYLVAKAVKKPLS